MFTILGLIIVFFIVRWAYCWLVAWATVEDIKRSLKK